MSDLKIKESNLHKWLYQAQKSLREHVHFSRVENGVQSGTPDLNICYRAKEGWLELKAITRPARSTTCLVSRINLKPSQVSWMLRRQRAGGRVAVFLQIGSGAEATKYMVPIHWIHHLINAAANGSPFTEAKLQGYEVSLLTPEDTLEHFFTLSRFKGDEAPS